MSWDSGFSKKPAGQGEGLVGFDRSSCWGSLVRAALKKAVGAQRS
jgi:hypothetical protein